MKFIDKIDAEKIKKAEYYMFLICSIWIFLNAILTQSIGISTIHYVLYVLFKVTLEITEINQNLKTIKTIHYLMLPTRMSNEDEGAEGG